MQEYSFSDINEAKRRVQEMKNKAKESTGERSDALSLIASLSSDRDKALALAMLYLMNEGAADENLLGAILYILFN